MSLQAILGAASRAGARYHVGGVVHFQGRQDALPVAYCFVICLLLLVVSYLVPTIIDGRDG